MNDIVRPENYVGLLIQSLAELADRLRHSSAEDAAETAVPACNARLEISAALLNRPELSHEMGILASLGDSLADLLAAMRDSPGRDLRYLGPALELLSDILETKLQRLDAGEKVQDLAGDPLWLAVISRLKTAGTPLEIMDDFESCARVWERRWCDRDLPVGQERELRRRWSTFREFGDAMFGATGDRNTVDSPPAANSSPVVLLVESLLRREQLLHKLQDLGYAVHTAVSPKDATQLVRAPGRVAAVLCDNLEPSNHLARLVALVEGEPGLPPLILVTTGSGNPEDDLQRARSLGANGVWTEPFQSGPLSGLSGLQN